MELLFSWDFNFFFLGGCTINKDYIYRGFTDKHQAVLRFKPTRKGIQYETHMAICNQLNMIFGCDLNWGILSNSYLMGNLIIINVCVFFWVHHFGQTHIEGVVFAAPAEIRRAPNDCNEQCMNRLTCTGTCVNKQVI